MEYMLGVFPACILRTIPLVFLTLGGVVYAHAQSTSPSGETVESERSLLVARFAAEKVSHWQRKLALQDWTISVVVSRATELKPNTLGNIHWDQGKKTAVLRVLDPADYHVPVDAILRDIEYTVVHELIHLEIAPVLADLRRTTENRAEEEHAVNHMAEALLQIDHSQ